jgi:hypothetical protein
LKIEAKSDKCSKAGVRGKMKSAYGREKGT